jgi:phenylpropionate dioxygenase-like ring-hydroxylating dioxygenase large terminal subunit
MHYTRLQLLLGAATTCCLLSSAPPFIVESLQFTPTRTTVASLSRVLPFLDARKVASSRNNLKKKNRRLFAASSSSLIEQADAAVSSDEDDSGAQLGAWIPIGSAAALASLSPTCIKVMNMDLAVWYSEETKQWSVLSDACPHRLAPLSQGRINPATGCIECAYHGWQFDTDGKLQDIPQLSSETKEELQRRVASNPKSKYNAQQFPVHLAGDLLFAFFPTAIHGESFPRFLLPEQMYPGLTDQMAKLSTYYVRDLPYSFDFLVENFMDPAHIPFAHHGLQGVREDGSDIPMNMLVNNFTMVEVAYKDLIRNKTRE